MALAFGTQTEVSVGCCIKDCPPPPLNLPNREPIPLLVASEHTSEERIIAAIPERIVEEDVVVGFETQTTGPFFSNDCVKEAAFYWTADNNNYTGLNTNLGFTQVKALVSLLQIMKV